LTAVAATSISSSPGPGSGAATSARRRSLPSPGRSTTTASIAARVASPDHGSARGRRRGALSSPHLDQEEGKPMKLIVRWVVAALALFVAERLIDGITVSGNAWVAFAAMAVVLGLVNALVRPLLKLLSCPLIILTLGLFTLVINALMLMLASWIAQTLGIGFQVAGFWPAFLGALIVSIVTVVLSALIPDDDKKK
jgi:putative membrane protein